jgi:hypothetical protein
MRELNPLTYSALTTFGKVSEPSLELFHYIVFIGKVKGYSLTKYNKKKIKFGTVFALRN